jgi:hypothetical protein
VKFRSQYKSILESIESPYSSIVKKSRLFFPRNFTLSPEFVKAFKIEFKRLKEVYNTSDSDLLRKINKALIWLIR